MTAAVEEKGAKPSKLEQAREKYPWLDHLVRAGDRILGARHQWRAGPQRDVPGGHLVAQVANRLRRRRAPHCPNCSG